MTDIVREAERARRPPDPPTDRDTGMAIVDVRWDVRWAMLALVVSVALGAAAAILATT